MHAVATISATHGTPGSQMPIAKTTTTRRARKAIGSKIDSVGSIFFVRLAKFMKESRPRWSKEFAPVAFCRLIGELVARNVEVVDGHFETDW
jgi:hypothetical protein